MNFLKSRLIKTTIALALLTGMTPALAQDMKIGVVNIPALMERIPQTRAALEALEEEFAPRQRELVAKQKEYQDLLEKVQKDVQVMGETERRNAEKGLRDLGRDVTRIEQEIREDFNLRRNEELAKLQRSVLQEVQEFAQAQGYDLIVGDGVLFASTAVNVTDDVLAAVEANYAAAN
jgi:outer membrane protein